MNKNQALDLVAKGLNLANQKGVFDLNSAASLVQAIQVLALEIQDRIVDEPTKPVKGRKDNTAGVSEA